MLRIMEALSVKEYRNNLAATFDQAKSGHPVYIRRKGHLYALSSVGTDNNVVTPQLKKRIKEAEEAYMRGECSVCRTPEELKAFFDSL